MFHLAAGLLEHCLHLLLVKAIRVELFQETIVEVDVMIAKLPESADKGRISAITERQVQKDSVHQFSGEVRPEITLVNTIYHIEVAW